MLRTTLLTVALAAVAAFAQPALAQSIGADGVLRDPAGRTLYVFDRDHPWGASNCYEGCAEVWPAFIARIGAEVKGELTVHVRTDGRMQWGWNGTPLYSRDEAAEGPDVGSRATPSVADNGGST